MTRATPSRRALLRATAGGAALASLGPVLAGCVATNAATGRTSFTGLTSTQDEIAIGKREHPKLMKAFGGHYEDRKLQAYLDDIGRRLAQHCEYDYPYTFSIANSPIANAFALPGGPVTITRGLLALAENEAELAGVVGHELGHVNARHSAERMGQSLLAQIGVTALAIATGSQAVGQLASVGATAFLQSYSRDQEFEADSLAARYMSRAGYDPDAMVSFLATLREQSQIEARMMGLPEGKVDEFNMMSTHPRTIDRVKAAREAAAEATGPGMTVNRNEYLNAINGMLFGDDPEQGIVKGSTFTHPGLRFTFTVPDSFRLMNSDSQVVAQSPQGDAIVFDMARHGSASMPAYLRREWGAKASLAQVEAITVNGQEAATAVTRINTNAGQRDARLVAIKKDGNQVFRLLFLTVPNRTAQLSNALQRTTYSFRRLTAKEAAAVKPLRLVATRVRPGETVATLSRDLPYGRYNRDWFRLLNGLRDGDRLAPGDVVKLVIEKA